MKPIMIITALYAASAGCGGVNQTPAAAVNVSAKALYSLGFNGLGASDQAQAIADVGAWSLPDAAALAQIIKGGREARIDNLNIPVRQSLAETKLAALAKAYPTLGDLWKAANAASLVVQPQSAASFASDLDAMLKRSSSQSYQPAAADFRVQARLFAAIILELGSSVQKASATSGLGLTGIVPSNPGGDLSSCAGSAPPPVVNLPPAHIRNLIGQARARYIIGRAKSAPPPSQVSPYGGGAYDHPAQHTTPIMPTDLKQMDGSGVIYPAADNYGGLVMYSQSPQNYDENQPLTGVRMSFSYKLPDNTSYGGANYWAYRGEDPNELYFSCNAGGGALGNDELSGAMAAAADEFNLPLTTPINTTTNSTPSLGSGGAQ